MNSSARYVAANVIAKFSNLMASLILGIFLARILGPHDYGIYRTLRSISALAVGLASFLAPSTIIYFTSRMREKNKVFWTAFAINFAATLIILTLLVLLSPFFSLKYSVPVTLVLLAIFELVFIAFFPLAVNYPKGFGDFVTGAKIFLIYSILRITVIFVAFLFGLFGIFIWRNLYSMIFYIIAAVFLKRYVKIPEFDLKLAVKMIKYNIYLIISNSLIQFSLNYPVLILGKIDPKEAAFFSVAFFASNLITIFYQSLVEVGIFRLAGVKSEYEVVKKVTKYSTYIAGFLFTSYLAFGKEIINLLFSKSYVSATYPLYIMSLAFFIVSSATGITTHLLNEGDTKILAAMAGIRAALTLLLTPLIFYYRAAGAALDFSLALLASTVFAHVYAHYRNIRTGRTHVLVSLSSALPAILFGKILSLYLPTLLSVLIVPPITTLLYISVITLLRGFDEYDRELLLKVWDRIRAFI